MKADLLARLQADAPLVAIVEDRGQWYRRPRAGELPDYTLTIAGMGRIYHHGGAATLAHPRVRCECWGRTYLEAGQLADALQTAIETTGTSGTTRFVGAFLEMEQSFDPETLADGTEVVRIIRDFTVWHQPA